VSKTVKLKADGLLAQALEHEVDHLNGILYLDHLKEHEELRSVEADLEYQKPGHDSEEVTVGAPVG
jgi:peptide deformylase